MGVKRKASRPPPVPQADSSDEHSSSSEEEEQEHVVAPVISSKAKTPQPTQPQVDQDESETESGSDSDPEPPPATKSMIVQPHKPSQSEEDSSDEEEEEEEVVKPKSPLKKAESEPEKKKPKLSAAAAARIWSEEDEMALLRALSDYHSKTGKLPSSKDYASFLSTISGSIGFPVTEKQLSNKITLWRQNYCKKMEKGTDVKISKPHDKAIFDISSKLFNGCVKRSKKGAKLESNSDTDTENGGFVGASEANSRGTNGGKARAGAANGDASTRSNFYFKSFIEDMIKEQGLPIQFTAEDVVARIGESRVQKMSAKIKDLAVDTMKLRAMEKTLKGELFATIGDVVANH